MGNSYNKEYQRQYALKHKKKKAEYSKQYYINNKYKWEERIPNTPEGRVKLLLKAAKSRAKKKGLDFNLVLSDLVIPEYCPVLGIKLDYGGSNLTSGLGAAHNRASLDRLDNSKGYTKDNTVIISLRANLIKRDSSLDELEKVISYLKKYISIIEEEYKDEG